MSHGGVFPPSRGSQYGEYAGLSVPIVRVPAVSVGRFSGAQAFGVAVGAGVGAALAAAVGASVGAGVGLAPPEQAARSAPVRARTAAKRDGVRMGDSPRVGNGCGSATGAAARAQDRRVSAG